MTPYYQQCVSILLQYEIDSNDTQTSVTAGDRGGLWKVVGFVGTIFLEYEKIFRSFTLQF